MCTNSFIAVPLAIRQEWASITGCGQIPQTPLLVTGIKDPSAMPPSSTPRKTINPSSDKFSLLRTLSLAICDSDAFHAEIRKTIWIYGTRDGATE